MKTVKNKYAAISFKEDSHLFFVERHLDFPFILLDLSTNLQRKKFTFRYYKNAFSLFLNEEPLTNITAIWHRRLAIAVEKNIPVAPDHQAYSAMSLF